MTTPLEQESTQEGLEKRARDSRTRLLETIDALERRGAHLVESVRRVRQAAAVAVDAVAVIGALMSLMSLLKASDRRLEMPSRRRTPGGVLGRLAMFAVFAGVAYLARPRRSPTPNAAWPGRSPPTV